MNNKKYFEIFAIFTIGFPFVTYKIILGHLGYMYIHHMLGYLLISLGIIDFGFNLYRLIKLFILGHARSPVCFLAFMFKTFHPKHTKNIEFWRDVGGAVDIMLSFLLVSIMVGGNLFPYVTYIEILAWNYSTVVNVMGAGTSRMISSIQLRRNKNSTANQSA